MKISLALAFGLGASLAESAAVFAHFMMSNAQNYTADTWAFEMKYAKEAGIDAFAMNIAYNEKVSLGQMSNMLQAASGQQFPWFFSFDYAGNGAFPKQTVIDMLKEYGPTKYYYKYNGKPFVSTFEGPGNALDWSVIKAQTGCFFMPDWSSLGAKEAVGRGTADGLFSWAAWPWGNHDMDTYTDSSYTHFLGGLPYMMPVSPWFYTNVPFYGGKNWLWRSDHLWFDRWNEVNWLKPEFVEIISWNDYPESHYIGPLRPEAMGAFTTGKAPYNYATDMPHDGWRAFLPYLITLYKTGTATVTKEGLQTWYRINPKDACGTGGTSANTASQIQLEFAPSEVLADEIFFSALLGSPADVTVTIGGASVAAKWSTVPDGNVGVYHGSVPFGGRTGAVVVTIKRNGATIAIVNGRSITTGCTNGIANYNAWVGSAMSASSISATPPRKRSEQVCVKGTGANNFAGLCAFTCQYGYCPPEACVCLALGKQATLPKETGTPGFPAAGLSEAYSGLCRYACNYGYCPTGACSTTKQPLIVPTVSEFAPPVCIKGTGSGNIKGLCEFACNYGNCPMASCKCLATGALNAFPAFTPLTASAADDLDGRLYNGLCQFSCSYGYCPAEACKVAQGGQGGIFTPKPLGPESSCDDISKTTLSRDMWDQVDATTELSQWWSANAYTTDYCKDLARPLGIGEQMTCRTDAPCSRPNCNDMGPAQYESGSGWAYLVLLSCANLNIGFNILYNSVFKSWTAFAALKSQLEDTFFFDDSDAWKNLLLKEILFGVAGAMTIIATAAGPFLGVWGAVAAANAASAVSSSVVGITLTMKDSDATVQNLITLENTARDFVSTMSTGIDTANTGFISDGHAEGIATTRIFDDGYWLVSKQIPILNTDTKLTMFKATEIDDYFANMIQASLVNAAWKKQNVYIFCIPMTKAEFDSTTVEAGNNNAGLKYYESKYGKGCYFQSAFVDPGKLLEPVSLCRNPPGWDDLKPGSSTKKFNTQDILAGSIESFYNNNGAGGGFNYQPDDKHVFALWDEFGHDSLSYKYPGKPT
ncbi:hypothetical protein ONS96_014150 [Cadophora gregata f. sp. sojae]|nr:hypothetical protein ONS96_014150 [Cadophora gregata f. sp. sojae]